MKLGATTPAMIQTPAVQHCAMLLDRLEAAGTAYLTVIAAAASADECRTARLAWEEAAAALVVAGAGLAGCAREVAASRSAATLPL